MVPYVAVSLHFFREISFFPSFFELMKIYPLKFANYFSEAEKQQKKRIPNQKKQKEMEANNDALPVIHVFCSNCRFNTPLSSCKIKTKCGHPVCGTCLEPGYNDPSVCLVCRNAGKLGQLKEQNLKKQQEEKKQEERNKTRLEEIAKGEEEINRQKQELKTREEEVGKREEKVKQKEQNTNTKQEQIQKREEEIERKEQNIKTREEEVERREQEKQTPEEKRQENNKKQLLKWSGTAGNKQMVLLYKATRDGFTYKDFQLKCKGKGDVWVIISDVKGNVFGGYTSIGWKGIFTRVRDPAAYVYTLVNPHGIPPTKYNPKENSECIIDGGNISFGSDLFIADNSNSNNNSFTNFPRHYIDTTGKGETTFTGDSHFQIKEIEVWGTIAI